MINGIIFQRDEDRNYKGVEGDNWYLNDIFPESFEDFYCKNIEKSWHDSDCLDVCNDRGFIEKYMEVSRKENIKFRMLLCETDMPKPELAAITWNYKFIGYDYAYPGGSYYSAVFNDVCSQRIEQFKGFKLNHCGLFEDIDGIGEFIALRKRLACQDKDLTFEKGDFVIYKLYEIIL